MPRLPVPGEDDGTWGDLLNEYLRVSHNSDGTIDTSLLEEIFQQVGAVLAISDFVMSGDERLVLSLASNLTLPDASTIEGQEITIVAAASDLTITTFAGQTLSGQPTLVLAQGSTAKVTALDGSSIGAGWGWAVHSYAGAQFDLPPWFGQSIQDDSVVKMQNGLPTWVTSQDVPSSVPLSPDSIKDLDFENNEPSLVLRCDGTTEAAWETPALADPTNGFDVRVKMKIRGPSGPGEWYSELFTQTHDGLGSWDNFELAVVWSDGPIFAGGQESETVIAKPYLFWEWTEEGGSTEVQNIIRDTGIAIRNWITVRFTQEFATNELKMYREVQYGGDDVTSDGKRWLQMGVTRTTTDASSIDTGVTFPWAIGYRADIDIAWFEAYDGIDANKIIDIKPANLTAGATSFNDGLGNTWSTTQGSIVKTDGYAPANAADWSPAPNSVSAALDQIAARLSVLEP